MNINNEQIKEVTQKNTPSRFVKVSIIVAIVIVMNLFFNYGVSLVFNEPSYDQYIKTPQVVQNISTKEKCVAIGGGWSENVYPNEKGKTEISGYCDPNYTNQKNYEQARKVYEKKVFITLLSLGILSLILGGFLSLTILSISFAWGGVLSLIIASMRYWSLADSISKVIILAIALGLLIWLAVKKFNK